MWKKYSIKYVNIVIFCATFATYIFHVHDFCSRLIFLSHKSVPDLYVIGFLRKKGSSVSLSATEHMLDSWPVATSLPSLHANSLLTYTKAHCTPLRILDLLWTFVTAILWGLNLSAGLRGTEGAGIGWRDGRLTVWLTQAAGVFVCQGTMEKPMKQFSEGVINSALLPVCVAFAD